MPYSALDEMCLLDNEAECCVRIDPPSISKSLCSLNTREYSIVGLSLKIIRIPSTPQCSSGLVVQRTRTSRCDRKGGADDYCVEDHRLQLLYGVQNATAACQARKGPRSIMAWRWIGAIRALP